MWMHFSKIHEKSFFASLPRAHHQSSIIAAELWRCNSTVLRFFCPVIPYHPATQMQEKNEKIQESVIRLSGRSTVRRPPKVRLSACPLGDALRWGRLTAESLGLRRASSISLDKSVQTCAIGIYALGTCAPCALGNRYLCPCALGNRYSCQLVP